MSGWQSGAQTLSRCLIYNSLLSAPSIHPEGQGSRRHVDSGRGWRLSDPPGRAGASACTMEPALRVRAGHSVFEHVPACLHGRHALCIRRILWLLGTSERVGHIGAGQTGLSLGDV